MSLQYYNYPLNGGIDRTVNPIRADQGTFYDLFGFRHSSRTRGLLEQVPYFTSSALARGTYYLAGSQTEPTGSHVRGIVSGSYYFTDYVIYNGASQVPVFYQTTVPAAENVNTGCLLVINSVSGLAITLGSTLDIVIDGATTFKWRKNGGAYTTGVACAITGTAIDGGNATVYFLATSGFSVSDTWTWIRTDANFQALTNVAARPTEFCYYKRRLYYTSTDGRVMKVTGDPASALYAISVGYRPVYGNYLTVFGDHLIVAGFSKTYNSLAEATRIITIGWSDKTDVDDFIPTDTNEADQYVIPNFTKDDNIAPLTPRIYIVGVFFVQQQLFLATNFGLLSTTDLGLPIVFSLQDFVTIPLATGSPVVTAPGGVYLIGIVDIFFFDGGSFKSLGQPIISTLAASSYFQRVFGWFDIYSDQFYFYSDGQPTQIFTYQPRFGVTYRRACDFISTVCCVAGIGGMAIGSGNRAILAEDDGSSQPVKDVSVGTVYSTPKITTQMLDSNLAVVKEIAGVYLGAEVATATTDFYSTDADVQVQLYWYKSNAGRIDGQTAVTDANAVWSIATSNDVIPEPRTSFRGLALEVRVLGLITNKPPFRLLVGGLYPQVKNLQNAKVER